MDIGYVWDEKKYKAVKKTHQVRFYEVVSAFEDENGVVSDDPQAHDDRWIWVGQTHESRILAVVCAEEDTAIIRIITAFDADRRLLDEYQNR